MFKVAVAHSLELDSADAVAEILDQCREQLGDLKPQAGIIFMGIDHDFSLVLKKFMSVYPETELIGCTTDGELSSAHGCTEDSIVFMVFLLMRVDWKQFSLIANRMDIKNLIVACIVFMFSNFIRAARFNKLDHMGKKLTHWWNINGFYNIITCFGKAYI